MSEEAVFDRRIGEIFVQGLNNLCRNVALKCLENDVFVTCVHDPVNNRSCTLVDFENKMIKKNYQNYVTASQQLYDSFIEVGLWND